MAERTPPLAPGLTALDLIRQTLDRYLSGMKAYGMAGYDPNDQSVQYDFTDTYPSLLIAASDYVRGSKDELWLKQNYPGLKAWATTMLAMDREGTGLLEYPLSGNSGIWDKKFSVHAANWWDNIGFGHLDAYANALAYHSLVGMAELARRANQPDDARLYAARAEKLRARFTTNLLQSRHRSAGRLEECGWSIARLLLYFRQWRGHYLRPHSAR